MRQSTPKLFQDRQLQDKIDYYNDIVLYLYLYTNEELIELVKEMYSTLKLIERRYK